VASDFMRILAGLHQLDRSRLELDESIPPDLTVAATREIDKWEGLYRFGDVAPDPMIEFGLGWLRRNVPAAAGPVVIVQGDTGPGNFLYADGRVTAVLDWELAHWGDPMEDLGWLALRPASRLLAPHRLGDRPRPGPLLPGVRGAAGRDPRSSPYRVGRPSRRSRKRADLRRAAPAAVLRGDGREPRVADAGAGRTRGAGDRR
jgi:prepilin-type processing-associated H-X9-DG protein